MLVSAARASAALLALCLGIGFAGCGARSGVDGGTALSLGGSSNAGSSNSGGSSGAPVDAGGGTMPDAAPSCRSDLDCASADRCQIAHCLNSQCEFKAVQCNDNDPCTNDTCDSATGACSFKALSMDLDGDGHFAPRPGMIPACGDDCDDTSAAAHPGGTEICDGVDNDCNGVVDDGATYSVPPGAPVRVASTAIGLSDRAGLAFDGTNYGSTYSGHTDRWRAYFKALTRDGSTAVPELQLSNVNADSYGGQLLWNGASFATIWADARQASNYEVYFNRINQKGDKLGPDLRISNADGFSLNPVVLWNGVEFTALWDDRRFDTGDDAVNLFGQRISVDGKLLGDNVQITPAGIHAEFPSVAMGHARLGIVFASAKVTNVMAQFMTLNPDLSGPSQPVTIGFSDVQNPAIAYIGGNFVIVWEEYSTQSGPAIHAAVVSEAGIVQEQDRTVTAAAPHARSFGILPLGDRLLLVWGEDAPGDDYDLYAEVLSGDLSVVAPKLRVTRIADQALNPVLSSGPNGSVGILFNAIKGGIRTTSFTRLECAFGSAF